MSDLKVRRPSLSDMETVDYTNVDVDECLKVVGMPKVNQVVKDGKVTYDVQFVETPLEELNKGLKVSDFAIDVLLASGYEKHFIDTGVVPGMDDIDRIVEESTKI